MVVLFERRRRPRLKLRATVRVCASGARSAGEGRVVNISSQGVLWISKELFQTGEQFEGSILIAGSGFGADAGMRLCCSLRVVRTEDAPDGFGIGCRLEECVLAWHTTDVVGATEKPVNGNCGC